MAGNIRWNNAGFRALRTDPKVVADIEHRIAKIAAAAGPGFEAKPVQTTGGRVRSRAAVVSVTHQAAAAEATSHVLLKALDAGR